MARSRSRRRRKGRSSISCYLRDIVDATEDFVDDVLDDAGELECDIRHSLSKALDDDGDDNDDSYYRRDHDRYRDRDRDRDRVRQERNRREITDLKSELVDLKDKIARMTPEQR